MRALLVLPIAMAVGAWEPGDPCTLSLPDGRSGGNTAPWAQLLNHQLNLAACVARSAPRAMLLGDPSRAKARVRAACVGYAVASGAMTPAQASALTDRLVDQEIDFLLKCPY